MITLEFIVQKWDSLDSRDDLVAAHQFDFLVLPSGSPLIVKDTEGKHHLLIPIERNEKAFEDKRSSGVQILVTNWGDEGKVKRYIDVICQKPYLNNLFDMLVFDILKSLETNSSKPEKICRDILSRWRDLLSKDQVNLPDKNTLIGVFGELWVLRSMAQHNPFAVDIWVGPEGARFDFINENKELEVKTTLQRKGCIITIHGYEQLEPIESSELFLTILKGEELPVGGHCIVDLVNSLVDIGVDRLSLFNKLNKVNISAANINESSYLRIMVISEKMYLVDKSFPAVTRFSFKNDEIPNNVIDLTYQIDLSSEPPFHLTEEQRNHLYQLISQRGQ